MIPIRVPPRGRSRKSDHARIVGNPSLTRLWKVCPSSRHDQSGPDGLPTHLPRQCELITADIARRFLFHPVDYLLYRQNAAFCRRTFGASFTANKEVSSTFSLALK